MNGILYAVGVGPGDPELLTCKAVRLLLEADVVAYPVNSEGFSMARQVVADHVGAQVEEYGFLLPVGKNQQEIANAYDAAARVLGGFLSAGKTVVLLCLGDAGLYGSASYLIFRLSTAQYRTQIVPAVVAPVAAAAELGIPLAMREETVRIVPATCDDWLEDPTSGGKQTLVLVKIGGHLQKLREGLRAAGLEERAFLVIQATFSNQEVVRLCDWQENQACPYFALLIVPASEAWDRRNGLL